ncbi:MAG TPA: roadblock/LC7 domain-containing protein [Myxococcota bacterium]|jgi:predicted regulator of Ras-like GTPase activity (Roadblock/LC7/MglB family)|nr:roadblock/LC7 domain-containing protein [Myxococcota bacterium]
MSFRSILRDIVEECGGGLGAVLMGADGIPIEEYVTDRIPEGPLQEDVGSAGVEFSRILEEIRKAADALGGGAVHETVVSLARMSLVFRPIDGETFLALVLSTDGNLGKARYLIRRHLLAIRQEL